MSTDSDLDVRKFDESQRDAFFQLHSKANGCEWCNCIAWWVPTWEGWGERTEEQNRAFREDLLKRGEYDGYLLYEKDIPVGWCQVGKRDRLEKLVRQFELRADPEAWAITCFFIAPSHRNKGLAQHLLQNVLDDLHRNSITRIEAFPRRTDEPTPGNQWTGPERMYRAAGFDVIRESETSPILAKTFPRK